ncbi:FAD synthetase family protein [Sporosarcina sp. FSL W7-1349]|uniref:FAD synthetase family protein n=1 Tax=Sporosarcina sp. FSL W7-1349 TaxID=2921561 RepID=UPI0030F8B8CA
MEVIFMDKQNIGMCEPAVLALGFFDGVHIGHMRLIEKAEAIAKRDGLQLAVMTFYPHPKEVLAGQKFDYLMSLEAKIDKMEKLGVGRLYVVKFTKEFAQLSPEQFVQEYIVDKQVKHVVAGFDYTYGHMGKGNMDVMERLGEGRFGVTVLPKVVVEDRKISSTYIRDLLIEGEVESIKSYLGSEYVTRGIISAGRMFPKDHGYCLFDFMPTEETMLPKEGIYRIEWDRNEQMEAALAIVYLNEENEKSVAIKVRQRKGIFPDKYPVAFRWLELLESGDRVAEKEIMYS